MLSACGSDGKFEALERTLPPTPEYVREVPEPSPAEEGDYAVAVIDDYKKRLRRANWIIRSFRNQYEGIRRQYSGREQ